MVLDRVAAGTCVLLAQIKQFQRCNVRCPGKQAATLRRVDAVQGDGQCRFDALLRQALINLVTNAVTHSPAGGRLHVRLSADAQRLLLQVEDQGPGIPAEDLERVFERFYSRGTVQGAGLGLAIVQSIARRHAGQIRLRNLDSGGLQASLELPRSA